MIIKLIPTSLTNTVTCQLPNENMVVDPRPAVGTSAERYYKFRATVEGRILTLTRIDRDTGWYTYDLQFRVYDSNEKRFSFESTKYIYQGLKHEKVPHTTTELFIKDGVNTIHSYACFYCINLTKVNIPDSVTRIDFDAFWGCTSLRYLRLPPNLQYIGARAFCECMSLEAIYLPPSINHIGDEAFVNCESLRIVSIPKSLDYLGKWIFGGCCQLLDEEVIDATADKQRQWLRNRMNTFHYLCCSPTVTAESIIEFIRENNSYQVKAETNDKPRMTGLHLLSANPYATGDMVLAYLALAPDIATVQDSSGKTALHSLCSLPFIQNDSGYIIKAILTHGQGKKAAFTKDAKGRAPFAHLCLNIQNDIPFMKNSGFSGLLMWWYEQIGVDFFTEVGISSSCNRNQSC